MNYGNCARCGRLVAYNHVRICNNCKELELEEVKKYIDEKGTVPMNRLCSDLGIPKGLIVEFINEGSLEIKYFHEDEIEGLLEKERRKELVEHLNSLQGNSDKIESQKEELKVKSRMRFINTKR